MVVLALEFRHLSSSCSWPLLTVYGDETAPLDVGHQSHLFLSLLFFLLSCRCKRTTANMYDTQGQQQTNADASAQKLARRCARTKKKRGADAQVWPCVGDYCSSQREILKKKKIVTVHWENLLTRFARHIKWRGKQRNQKRQ